MSDCTSEPPAIPLIGISDLFGGFRRNLAAARIREERLHRELAEVALKNLEQAWCCSTHHHWMEEAWDFICQDSNCWWHYESAGQKLRNYLHRLHVEGHNLYSHEEDEVREVAAKLTQYSHALRAVALLEKQRYTRTANPPNAELSHAPTRVTERNDEEKK